MRAAPQDGGMGPEQALAGHVVRWLLDDEWDVRQEVACDGRVADIVARRGPLVRVIECKMSFGLDLLAQTAAWIPFAHSVLAASQAPVRKTDARRLGRQVAEGLGIGVLDVDRGVARYGPHPVRLRSSGRMLRRPPCLDFLRTALDAIPSSFDGPAAGTGEGGHWTPYRKTCEALARMARLSPGIPLRDALKAMTTGHHYADDATARSSLATRLGQGVVHGIEGRVEAGVWRLWPAEG